MRLVADNPQAKEQIDIKELYLKYCDEYNSVFIEDFGEDGTFIFHSLGRADYRHLIEDDNTSLADKEEIVCEICTLYPEGFDFENCENAGLPSRLAKSIFEKSLLDKPDNLHNIMAHFRDQLYNSINQQMSCAIHEAFPEYEIDEIDNWDIAKACEYMAKAEFILHNLRGVPLNPMEQVPQEEAPQQRVRQPDTRQPKTHEIKDATPPARTKPEKASAKKSKLSPQKLAELQARFPEIDWSNDNAAQGIQGFMHQDVDARSRLELNTENSSYVDASGQDALPPAMRSRFKVIGDLTEDALQGKPE